MSVDPQELRQRARATWAAGDWDSFAKLIAPVGERVIERAELEPGQSLLDVGTGSGGTVAVPVALRGASVVGADITPELLEHARRRAQEAGVEVEWVECDAQDLPFDDASFDRVTSTFGAMFAPDHARAAAELVRVCKPGGRVLMTTWVNDGMAGEMFKLTGRFLPPPPPGIGTPPQWGFEDHITEMFAAAGATPEISRHSVSFVFPSLDEVVRHYGEDFGPFVMASRVLEPQGRWQEFLDAFRALAERFGTGGEPIELTSEYFLITVDR
jgi:ubiquinone/menaquinone biosynthesis C-methylase UbiE